ncbi:MAG: IclR family transcriptional regulator [Pseudomonadota bacterium]
MARAAGPRKRSDAAAQPPASATPSKGLDRSLSLLEILADVDGISLSDIALRAGVPASTAHRILMTLEAHRFVSHDDERGVWFIGVRAFEIGNAFLRHRKLVDIGRSIMRALMEQSGESINLAIEDTGEAVYVSQVESHQSVRAFHRAGSRGPMHALAVGKALLSAMSDADVRRVLEQHGMETFSDRTIRDPKRLFDEVKTIRSRGWATNNEEHEAGMCAVAAPIYNEYGEAIAAISITGPASRMGPDRLGELGPMVKRAAAEITSSIGGVHPGTAIAS